MRFVGLDRGCNLSAEVMLKEVRQSTEVRARRQEEGHPMADK